MKKILLAILFLMIAGIQTTAWAQKVVVHLQTGKDVVYDVTQVDSISFDEMMAEGHRYVDLGLPSGTLWATCNVGAESPEGYGDYFAWGETEPKSLYNWSTYKYHDSNISTHLFLTKYCRNSEEGTVDGKMILEAMDDAASFNWGSEWQMPSRRQFDELFDRQYTTNEWTTLNGVNGVKITSKENGSSIFLPAAGYREDSSFEETPAQGIGVVLTYWSRLLSVDNSEYADLLFCANMQGSNGAYVDSRSRSIGLTVRPVRYQEPVMVSSIELSDESLVMQVGDTWFLSATVKPQEADIPFVTWESSDETVATVDAGGMVTAIGGGTCTITCRAKDGSGTYAQCQVTVSMTISSIKFSQETLYMVVDGTKTLTPTVEPTGADASVLSWKSSNESIATVDANGTISAIEPGSCYITCFLADNSSIEATCEVIVQNYLGYVNGRKWVNLDLPSGTLWATCNVGVSDDDNYEQGGNLYAWGETQPKTGGNDWSSYSLCNGSRNTMTKYCQHESYGYNGFTDGLTELLPEDDAATANWGDGWQMPSEEQFRELLNTEYTTWYWTEERGVKGVKIKGNSDSMTIFLPAAGSSAGFSDECFYWTRSLYPSYDYWGMMYTSGGGVTTYNRYFGLSVRPVVRK